MLFDWFADLLTPCPRHFRALGYLRELRGIRARERAWSAAWAPHLENTRGILRAAAARCTSKRKAVVLGSGWLSDVPLAEVAEAFDKVVLVDALHPRAVRRQVRRWPNVELLAADVTGTTEAVWRRAAVPGATLPRTAPDLFVRDPEVDLVASVNLLSQLPCLPERYLLEVGVQSAEAIAAYSRGVVEGHLEYLRRLPGAVALIADVEMKTLDAAGQVVKREDTLFGARFPYRGQTWDWPIVPRQRRWPHHAQHLAVVGVVDLKGA